MQSVLGLIKKKEASSIDSSKIVGFDVTMPHVSIIFASSVS